MRGRIVFGLLLLTLGVAWMLDATGVYTFPGGWAVWWPAIIVAFGFFQLLATPAWWEGPVFLMLAGGFLLAWRLDAAPDWSWTFVAPALLIVLALFVIAGAFGGRRRWQRRMERWSGPHHEWRHGAEDVAVFGNVERRHEEEFKGGEVTGVFGNLRADLTHATLPREGARMKATSVFGSVEVRVPPGWKVRAHGTPIFGRLDDHTRQSPPDDAPTLDVEYVSVFGNVALGN